MVSDACWDLTTSPMEMSPESFHWSIEVGGKSVVLSTLLTFIGPLPQFADPKISEQQVGRWIVSLNNDSARRGS